METIATEYAGYLHEQSFNPYSQYCAAAGGGMEWTVSALGKEACENILPALQRLEEVRIKKLGLKTKVCSRELELTSLKDLAALIHGSAVGRHKLQIVTPMSFKQGGKYQILPDLRLMFQNLLMHYSQLCEGSKEADQETVGYMVEHARIGQYDLASRYYKVAGSPIPAFMGKLTIEVSGPAPMAGLVHMLLKFGEYSGVGIKTAMGMGAIKLVDC